MATFAQIAEDLKKIDFDVILNKVFSSSNIQKWVTDTVKSRIQQTGIDAAGDKLKTDRSDPSEFYADLTIVLKELYGSGVGAVDSHVTLTDTGSFWQSMRIALINDGFNIDADFQKDDGHMYNNFTRDYANQEDFEAKIMGLSDNELEIMLNTKVIPQLIKEFNAAL